MSLFRVDGIDRAIAQVEAVSDDLYDEGWSGTVTTDRILAILGGILGGATVCLGLLYKYGQHLNRTSKGHRP